MIIYEGGKQRIKKSNARQNNSASFDKVFKAIWQDERNKNLLLYKISKLLLINKNRIYQNLVFKNTELSEEKYENKGLIIDLIIPLILK